MLDATKPLPEDINAEKVLLSYAVYYGLAEPIIKNNPWLTPEMFKLHAHQEIWKAVKELVEQGDQCDGVAVITQLGIEKITRYGLNNTLADISDAKTGRVRNPAQFARAIREQYQRREAIRQLTALTNAFMSGAPVADSLEAASKVIYELQTPDCQQRAEFVDAQTVLMDVMEDLEQITKSTGALPNGLATGITALDAITGGLKPSTLNIVAGRPGMGKSAYMTKIAFNVALGEGDWIGFSQEPRPVLIVTLEMSNKQIMQRETLGRSKINSKSVRQEILTNGGMSRVIKSMGTLKRAKVTLLDAPAISIRDLGYKLRRHLSKHPVSLVVVDYLQLIKGSKKERHLEVGEVSMGLKALAKEFNIPILSGAQVGRESDKGDPKISDLRESGNIEQDADLIMLLHRPAYYAAPEDRDNVDNDEVYCNDMNGNRVQRARIIIGKNRDGDCDTINLGWVGKYTQFISLTNKLD